MTGFAKRGLIHAIINIEKSRFEILNTVYLENAWCLVYEILHQSIVIQGNSADVLFDGLLAELPAILDSFFSPVPEEGYGKIKLHHVHCHSELPLPLASPATLIMDRLFTLINFIRTL